MVVFIVGRGIPTSEAPTNGIFEYKQALAISEQGIDVYYIYADIRSFRHKRKLGLVHTRQGSMEIIGYSIPVGRMPMGIRVFFRKLGYKKIFHYCKRKKIRPDLIHAHFLEVMSAIVELRECFDVPIIGTEHFSRALEYGGKCEEKIKNRAYNNIDKLICVSPYLQTVLKDKYDADSIFIPNMVDDEKFTYRDVTRKYDFLCVGDLNENKNFRGVLQAFVSAFSKEDEVTLNIVGVGLLEVEFKKIIKENGRENQIHLLGALSNDEVAELMQRTRTLILNSHKETFGVVCIEAMMCGTIVIATCCGGPEFFMDDLGGILIKGDDVHELSLWMKKIYTRDIDEEQRIDISSRTSVEFSKSSVVCMLLREYRNIARCQNGDK